MKATNIPQFLTAAVKAAVPALVSGAPGCGKSALIRQWCDDNGYALVTWPIQSVPDLADLIGLPWVEKGQARLTPFQPELWKDGQKIVLFFDDFNRGSRFVIAAAMELIESRRFRDLTLGDSVEIFAAINEGSTDNVTQLDTAALTRFAKVNVSTDYDSDYEPINGITLRDISRTLSLSPDTNALISMSDAPRDITNCLRVFDALNDYALAQTIWDKAAMQRLSALAYRTPEAKADMYYRQPDALWALKQGELPQDVADKLIALYEADGNKPMCNAVKHLVAAPSAQGGF